MNALLRQVISIMFILFVLQTICDAELRKKKKVRCHPSCCPKQKTPKSLLGRYMFDVIDGSESAGDDIFDLVYVLIKLAKGTYKEFTEDTSPRFTNETTNQEYRYDENTIPGSTFSFNMLDAVKRSSVRTRYAPGQGVIDGELGTSRHPGRTQTSKSIFRGLSPQFNFNTQSFLGLNVSTQSAVAVSL